MLIHPVEAAHGYQQQRQPPPGTHGDAAGTELLPEGTFNARIDALLANGQVRVRVAGRSYQFTPPVPMQPGDVVTLRVAARTPHLVLELANAAAADPDLSSAATLLARLATPGAPRAGLISAATPATTAPPADTAKLAAHLAQAIARSGLFYESHQAEWVAGLRPLALLGAEPQSRLRAPGPGPRLAARPAEPATGPATQVLLPGAAGSPERLQVAAEALPLIQAQLDALDSRCVQWRGELWPGLWAEWEISEDHAGREGSTSETPAPDTWQTRLDLVLPRLGPVSAVLRVQPSGATIRITAVAADSTVALQTHAPALHSAMSGAGINVNGLQIDAAASGAAP